MDISGGYSFLLTGEVFPIVRLLLYIKPSDIILRERDFIKEGPSEAGSVAQLILELKWFIQYQGFLMA